MGGAEIVRLRASVRVAFSGGWVVMGFKGSMLGAEDVVSVALMP